MPLGFKTFLPLFLIILTLGQSNFEIFVSAGIYIFHEDDITVEELDSVHFSFTLHSSSTLFLPLLLYSNA